VAENLIETAVRRHEKHLWWLDLFLVMPDHVHFIATPVPEVGLKRIMAGWKRYTSRHLGINWQQNYFEHRLRNAASFEEKCAYIRHNPVRAGMVATANAWPYCWSPSTAFDGGLGETSLPDFSQNGTVESGKTRKPLRGIP